METAKEIGSTTISAVTGYPIAALWFTGFDVVVDRVAGAVDMAAPGGMLGSLFRGFVGNVVFIAKLKVYSLLAGNV